MPGERIWGRREASRPRAPRSANRHANPTRMRPTHDQRGRSRTLGLHRRRAFGRLALRPLADRRRRDRPHPGDASRRHAGDHRARAQRLSRLARGSRAAARRARAPAWRGIARLEGGPRRAGDARGRQDRLRGPGRSAGDDRHLRFRRRPLAAIVRPRHRLRAPGPSHDRDLASAGPVRDHFRLQFSGRGLVLERGARARLRRSGDLEAVGEDAALGAGDDEDPRSRHQALRPRRARRPRPDRHRRPGDRGGAGRLQARADRLRHRLDPHGLDRRARRSPRASAARSSSSAATTR